MSWVVPGVLIQPVFSFSWLAKAVPQESTLGAPASTGRMPGWSYSRFVDTGAWYRYFAEVEAKQTSPSYRRLANGVADDSGLIARLELLPAPKRQPNLLFASVSYLGGPTSDWESFRSFVETHWLVIRDLMLVRSTQTNEVARCGTILPVLAELDGPIALIEVGASAGLCLLLDRYSYSFNRHRVGVAALCIEVECTGPVPIPASLPEISWRCGIDLNPLDVTNADDLVDSCDV